MQLMHAAVARPAPVIDPPCLPWPVTAPGVPRRGPPPLTFCLGDLLRAQVDAVHRPGKYASHRRLEELQGQRIVARIERGCVEARAELDGEDKTVVPAE